MATKKNTVAANETAVVVQKAQAQSVTDDYLTDPFLADLMRAIEIMPPAFQPRHPEAGPAPQQPTGKVRYSYD